MDEESRYRQYIKDLKKHHKLVPVKNIKFDLSNYLIVREGHYYKNTYNWILPEFTNETYFISLKKFIKSNNNFEFSLKGTYYDFKKENAILMFHKKEFPQLIIRPKNLNEKIVNYFLKFDIKLANRKKFNSKYILESTDNKYNLNNLLTKPFTDSLLEYQNLNIEFYNKIIVIKFDNKFNLDETLNLFKIAYKIESILFNENIERLY